MRVDWLDDSVYELAATFRSDCVRDKRLVASAEAMREVDRRWRRC